MSRISNYALPVTENQPWILGIVQQIKGRRHLILPLELGRFPATQFRSTWRLGRTPGQRHGFTLWCVPVVCPGVYRAERTNPWKMLACWLLGASLWSWARYFIGNFIIRHPNPYLPRLSLTLRSCRPGLAHHRYTLMCRCVAEEAQEHMDLERKLWRQLKNKVGIPVFSKAVYKVPAKTSAIWTVSLIWTNSSQMNRRS